MEFTRGIVQDVILDGKHGPYAVATVDQIEGSVTFSLDSTVWKSTERPVPGLAVFLGKIRQKRAGWRANEGRPWSLSDEQQAKSMEMEFLYPVSRQYPVDEICERIVRELEKRNWSVPSMDVEFSDYGHGDRKFRYVSQLTGPEFKLWFCRTQQRIPGTRNSDIAAVTEIRIPRKEIHLYEDESGPTFYLYVGNDWEKDREAFLRHGKVHSKMDGKPKTYLQYSGSATKDGRYTYEGRRSPYLVHTNDCGREYEPEGTEPRVLKTQDTLREFRDYLKDVVLAQILACPVADKPTNRFVAERATPWPELIGDLFTFAEWRDAERIKAGREDPLRLDPQERYAAISNLPRLVSLMTRSGEPVPEIAYEGFIWTGVGEVTPETPIESLEVYGQYRWSDRHKYVIRIRPNRANGIYIADHAAYEKRRREIGETIGERNFTNEEVADFTCARGRTIVPVAEYQGGYEQPIVLIQRELSFDEVEVVSGPHPDKYR